MPSRQLTTPDAILQEALAREQEAQAFYAGLIPGCHVDFVRELLERLEDEETKHIRLIQEMITRLNLGHDIV